MKSQITSPNEYMRIKCINNRFSLYGFTERRMFHNIQPHKHFEL